MREVLFRGKRFSNGEWVYGYYVYQYGFNMMFLPKEVGVENDPYFYAIIPESIGQYTGLKDKNGVRVFEADIVRVDKVGVGVVTFKNAKFRCNIEGYDRLRYRSIEVIGNIHDDNLEDFL